MYHAFNKTYNCGMNDHFSVETFNQPINRLSHAAEQGSSEPVTSSCYDDTVSR